MSKSKIKPLMALFTAFPSQDRAGSEDEIVKIYLMAVERISAEYVASAVHNFITGAVERERHTFRPTAAELAVESRRLALLDGEAFRARRDAAEQKRLAEPMTASEQERAAQVARVLGKAKAKIAERVRNDMISQTPIQTRQQ